MLDELRAVAARGGRQRARQLARRDVAVGGISRPPSDVASARCGSSARAPAASTSSAATPFRESAAALVRKRRNVSSSKRDVERARAVVRRSGTPLTGAHACDKCVEQVEAADGELEERAVLARFDVRREHAGRRLRRAHARRPIVDDLDRCAAARQLVRHRAADDARADDDDVARGSHERILSP